MAVIATKVSPLLKCRYGYQGDHSENDQPSTSVLHPMTNGNESWWKYSKNNCIENLHFLGPRRSAALKCEFFTIVPLYVCVGRTDK